MNLFSEIEHTSFLWQRLHWGGCSRTLIWSILLFFFAQTEEASKFLLHLLILNFFCGTSEAGWSVSAGWCTSCLRWRKLWLWVNLHVDSLVVEFVDLIRCELHHAVNNLEQLFVLLLGKRQVFQKLDQSAFDVRNDCRIVVVLCNGLVCSI